MTENHAYVPTLPGPVLEIIRPDATFALKDRFHASYLEHCYPCDTSVAQGWTTQDGTTFTAPSTEPTDLKAYAASVRYEKEIGGITVAGMEIATDDRAKTLLLGARMAAEKNAAFTTPWSTADGAEHLLTAAQIIAISDAVLAHVSACFAAFSTAAAGIADGTITKAAAVDAAFASL